MKLWRRVFCMAMLLVLAAMLCACSAILGLVFPKEIEPSAIKVPVTPSATENIWSQSIAAGMPGLQETYFIRRLEPELQELCIGIYQGIAAFEEEITFPEPVPEETLSNIMWLLSYDCPELFQISGDYSYYVREDAPDMVLSISPNYILNPEEYEEAYEEIRAVISRWLDAAAGMDVYGTQLLIYDSIIDGCTYREDGTHTGTVYGALILGEARCEGYSKALCMALRAAGIESLILTGEAWSLEEGQAARPEKHAWNVAKLGDGYYQMDVTWDDPDGALPQGTCYAYFNLTDEAMYNSRTLDGIYDTWQPPACDDTKYNYYIRNGTFFPDGTDIKDALYAALDAAYEQGGTLVMCRLETDAQLAELTENLERWMTDWYQSKHFSRGAYNWTTYLGSRVFCILDLVYGG